MSADTLRFKYERDLARQSAHHHVKRERELERLLAESMASAKDKPHCKCETAKALRRLAAELEDDRTQR